MSNLDISYGLTFLFFFKGDNMTNKQGSKWITRKKRLAIYMRDNFTCAYCHATIENCDLVLDHIKPRVAGLCNDSSNLITSCVECNNAKGKSQLTDDIIVKITHAANRPLDDYIALSNAAILEFGSYSNVLDYVKGK